MCQPPNANRPAAIASRKLAASLPPEGGSHEYHPTPWLPPPYTTPWLPPPYTTPWLPPSGGRSTGERTLPCVATQPKSIASRKTTATTLIHVILYCIP